MMRFFLALVNCLEGLSVTMISGQASQISVAHLNSQVYPRLEILGSFLSKNILGIPTLSTNFCVFTG